MTHSSRHRRPHLSSLARPRARFDPFAILLALAAGCSGDAPANPRDAAVPDAGPTGDAGSDAGQEPMPDAGDILPPENAPDEEFRGGTRLKARFMESADGLRYFLGFWDEQLETECDFAPRNGYQPVPGLERHCIPMQNHGRRVYLDANCTGEMFFEASYTSEPPRFITLGGFEWGSCEPGDVFELGEAVEQGVQLYSNETVQPGCQPVDPEGVVHAIGSRREHTDFVRGQRVFAGTGQLRAHYWVGDDGSIERAGFYDAELRRECFAVHDQEGMLRCTPPAMTDPWVPDASGACQAQLSSPPDCPGFTKYVFISQSHGSTFWYTWYRLEERITEGPCAELEPEWWAYERAVELPGSTFVPLSITEVGGTRLVTRAVAHPDFEPYITGIEFPLDTDGLHDTQLEADCRPLLSADGSRRCLPGIGYWYTDAQCTRPASRGGDESALGFILGEDRTDPSAPRYHVFERGAQLASNPQLYSWYDGDCVPSTPPQDTLYEAGAELPPETFVAIDEVRR